MKRCSRWPWTIIVGWTASTVLYGAARPDVALADFEAAGFERWTARGEAFGAAPLSGAAATQQGKEFAGAGFAWSGHGGAAAKGELLAAEFTVERSYLNFLVAGERNLPSTLGVELLVNGNTVRSAAATEAGNPALYWRTFDVSDLNGARARLKIVDRSTTGALAIDAVALSDTARATPADATTLMHESLRPQFHYTARTGWLNDPNGLLYHRGTWHLFHQYQPSGSEVFVWGHATSQDLVHWQHRPPAIPVDPTDSYYSGSGAIDVANTTRLQQGSEKPLLLFYSRRPPGPKQVTERTGKKMTQELAFSLDGGKSWQQFKGNPILRTEDYRDRDPKVLWHAPTKSWYMVLSLSGNNLDRNGGSYGVFRSPDAIAWTEIQRLGPGQWYWECPDMFELPLDGDPTKTKWLLLNGTGSYILGSLDERGFTPDGPPINNRWGNYYAAQTFNDAPAGRRVQVGWMSTKSMAPSSYPGMPFNQQISIPRELTLRQTSAGPRLFRYPIRELNALRTRTHTLPERILTPGKNALDELRGDLLDFALEIDLLAATKLRLAIRGEAIEYDVAGKKLHAFNNTIPISLREGRLKLRILLDRTSIELFAQDGEVDVSRVFFPDPKQNAHSLNVVGGDARIRGRVHTLKSIWPKPAGAGQPE